MEYYSRRLFSDDCQILTESFDVSHLILRFTFDDLKCPEANAVSNVGKGRIELFNGSL